MLKIIGEMTSFSNEWCGLVGLFPLGLGPLVRSKSLCYLFGLRSCRETNVAGGPAPTLS